MMMSRNRFTQGLILLVTLLSFIEVSRILWVLPWTGVEDLYTTKYNVLSIKGHAQNLMGYQSFISNRSAIVFRTKSILAGRCNCERFIALATSVLSSPHLKDYDLILLQEAVSRDTPLARAQLLDWIKNVNQQYRVPRVYIERRNDTTPIPIKNKKAKLSFLWWAHDFRKRILTHKHYWLLEDDLYWTGEWKDVFEGLHHDQTADFISFAFEEPVKKMAWKKMIFQCEVQSQPCYNTSTVDGKRVPPIVVERSFNNLIRVSGRFVDYLVSLLYKDQLQGHDEISFLAALNHWQLSRDWSDTNRPYHAQLFGGNRSSWKGLNEMGGWGPWIDWKGTHVYTLRGLAYLYQSQIPLEKDVQTVHEAARYGWERVIQRNLDAPPNKLFHPVKCTFDRQEGPSALAWAIHANSIDDSRVKELQHIC